MKRAARFTGHPWIAASVVLVTSGFVMGGCEGKTGLITQLTLKAGLKIEVRGDFKDVVQNPRFGRLEVTVTGKGASLPIRVLTKTDLAALLSGTKQVDGVAVTNGTLTVAYADVTPGDYAVDVALYDKETAGTKLSDNPTTKHLDSGIADVLHLDLTSALAVSGPPAPAVSPSAPAGPGGLNVNVALIADGDGQAHPIALDQATPSASYPTPLAATFQITGSEWDYAKSQYVYYGPASSYQRESTVSFLVSFNASSPVQYAESDAFGPLYPAQSVPSLQALPTMLVRWFYDLGRVKLQSAGDSRTYPNLLPAALGGSIKATHYFLNTGPLAEDANATWPGLVSTHRFDLYYAPGPGPGLVESQETVYLQNGLVFPGEHVLLKKYGLPPL